MDTKKPSYEELKKKLAKAEQIIAGLTGNEAKNSKGKLAPSRGQRNTAPSSAEELKEAYIASEQNFKNSMDASPLGIRVVTDDGDLIYANKAILDICGYNTVEELAAVPQSQLYTPESYAAHQERKKRRRLKEHVPAEYEISIRRPDGEVRDLQVFRREVMWGGEWQFMAMYQDITDHKRAEEALRESEEKFHSIVEHGNDGIVFVQDGIIRYCNSKMLEICGYTEDEVLGKPFLDFVAPEHKEMVFGIYSRRIAGNKVQDRYELNLLGKGGIKIYTEISASLISYKQNQVDIAIIRDVTERKKAEEALADEAVRRRILVEQSRDGIVILDQNGKVFEVNQRFADMLGYSIEEAQQLSVLDWEFLYPRERVLEMIRTVDEKGDHFETQHRRKDGTTYDVEISTNGAMFTGRKLIFCVCRDITERKRAEQALKESQEMFSLAFHNSPTLVLISTLKDGRIIEVNNVYCRITGYSREELIGHSTIELNLWVDLEQRRSILEDLKEKDVVSNINVKVHTKTGDVRTVSMSLAKITVKNEPCLITIAVDITEREKAEQALKESETRFRSLFETMAQGVVYRDASGKIISANPAAEGILGLTLSQMQGRTSTDPRWRSLREDGSPFPGETHPSMVALQSGKPVHNVVMGVYNPQLEEYRWILINATPEFRKDKTTPYRAYTTFTDITERRKMQDELEKDRGEIKLIIDSSPILVFYKDKEGKFLRINEAFATASNMSEENLLGKTVFDLYSDDIAQGMTNDDNEVFESGKTKLNIIEQYQSATGMRWVQTDKIPIFDKNGKAIGLVGFAQDITERKQAEQRANHLNLALRSIRDVNQLITREKDRDKLLKGICDAFVQTRSFYTAWIVLLDESHQLLTYAHSGLRSDFMPLVEALKQGKLPTCIQEALKKKQAVIIEDPLRTCTECPIFGESADFGSMTVRLEYGENIYGALSTSLPKEILADADEVTLFQEVAADISFALYNMEREAEYQRLEQERLRAAKLESIGTLAGGIAHDFNNLLTGIMGNIGLAKTYISETDTIFEMLDEAEKAASRARDLTQQLLTFARGGKPVKKMADIAVMIKESASFALRGSRTKLELSLPEDLWLIEADEGQMSQVINNLVINADEAMPSGGTLKIQAENLTFKKTSSLPIPPGRYVHIEVKDTGVGMSPEHLQRIFEPYFTTKQRGSGLGLTTAYSIVRNHGGVIVAETAQNIGSTFHIYLPAAKKVVKGGKKLKAASSGQAGGKILVMDDEEIIRKMLKNMLSLGGYTVELSADGAEALEKYQQAIKIGDPFNAVIMDLTIPGGMGGKEAVKKLLEIDPSAAVIVSSGYTTDAIMSDYKKYGFKAVIAKPYSVKQLQGTLSGLLSKKKK